MKSKPSYVVCGTESADPASTPVFYALDAMSGYPYASQHQNHSTTDLMEAFDWLDDCGPSGDISSNVKMCNSKIMEITYVPVDITHIAKVATRVDEMLKGMSNDEKIAMKRLLS